MISRKPCSRLSQPATMPTAGGGATYSNLAGGGAATVRVSRGGGGRQGTRQGHAARNPAKGQLKV